MLTQLALIGLACALWPEAGLGPWAARRDASRHEPEQDSTVRDVADAVVLLALALRGGASITEALARVIQVVDGQVRADLASVLAAHRWGLEPDDVWSTLSPVWRPVALAWSAAQQAGVPPSALLLSASRRVREREDAAREAALLRAGVLLVIPLGGLFLPGFIATTVVPVVLHLLALLA